MVRVHDVRDVADYLAVAELLDGARELASRELLDEALRRQSS
jgi:hypothetical protein